MRGWRPRQRRWRRRTARRSNSSFLPLRNTAALQKLLSDQQTAGTASYHQWLTPAQYAARFGPTAASLANARASLEAAGLTVTAAHIRSLRVAGSAAQVGRAFQTQLSMVARPNGRAQMVARARPWARRRRPPAGRRAPTPLQYYHRNLQGFDGVWSYVYPSENYNYIYGNGSPDVRKLFGLIGFPPASTPQSAGNP